MFTVEQRDRVRDHLIEIARADGRIESAAKVGGSAEAEDRWSDIDLSFGLRDGVVLDEVLADWTRWMSDDFRAVTLFDLPFLSSLYRVFLLPGFLQVDLSFTPGSDFGALGPRFKLLFGRAVQRQRPPPVPAQHRFGMAVHHAVRARISIERGRYWHAEHWISSLRDLALELACLRLGLEPALGRGFDLLPPDVLEAARGALVREPEQDELLRALSCAVAVLNGESDSLHEEMSTVRALLAELST